MGHTGVASFANRPLSEREREFQMRQDRPLDVPLRDQLCVIRMNSTFLETVDAGFPWRGRGSAFALIVGSLLIMFAVALLALLLTQLATWSERHRTDNILFALGGISLLALMVWGLVKLLLNESFALTHYPIRYHRKNRMVYYIRANGSAGSVAWKDIFFTVHRVGDVWYLVGQVLAEDKVTVLETIPAGPAALVTSIDANPVTGYFAGGNALRSHWEFIRRYMEEGPQATHVIVQSAMPVASRKETPAESWRRIFANFDDGEYFWMMLAAPLSMLAYLGRLFVMATSKIPQWPAEIDAACVSEPDDPFAVEFDAAGDRVWDNVRI